MLQEIQDKIDAIYFNDVRISRDLSEQYLKDGLKQEIFSGVDREMISDYRMKYHTRVESASKLVIIFSENGDNLSDIHKSISKTVSESLQEYQERSAMIDTLYDKMLASPTEPEQNIPSSMIFAIDRLNMLAQDFTQFTQTIKKAQESLDWAMEMGVKLRYLENYLKSNAIKTTQVIKALKAWPGGVPDALRGPLTEQFDKMEAIFKQYESEAIVELPLVEEAEASAVDLSGKLGEMHP